MCVNRIEIFHNRSKSHQHLLFIMLDLDCCKCCKKWIYLFNAIRKFSEHAINFIYISIHLFKCLLSILSSLAIKIWNLYLPNSLVLDNKENIIFLAKLFFLQITHKFYLYKIWKYVVMWWVIIIFDQKLFPHFDYSSSIVWQIYRHFNIETRRST